MVGPIPIFLASFHAMAAVTFQWLTRQVTPSCQGGSICAVSSAHTKLVITFHTVALSEHSVLTSPEDKPISVPFGAVVTATGADSHPLSSCTKSFLLQTPVTFCLLAFVCLWLHPHLHIGCGMVGGSSSR